MLRYFYLLSLLICINLSFCYEYLSDADSRKRSIVERLNTDHRKKANLQQRKHRKRHDYDMYDKDPVAEIDVASFINSAEDETISENDPYNLRQNEKSYNSYDSLTKEMSNYNEDYLDVAAENFQDVSHYLNYNPPSEEKTMNDKLTRGYNKMLQHNLDGNGQNYGHHKEKKCVLKNIKLPFFSHNKTVTAKGKNDRKRKVYGFHNAGKGNRINNEFIDNLSKQGNSHKNLNLYKHNKIKKRSYIERLCPACRKKFIINQSLKSQRKRSNMLISTYNIGQKNVDNNLEDNKKDQNSYNVEAGSARSNEKSTVENYWNDRRRKREDDDRNIERQKELEYLEKRVESVTVNNFSSNKIKM